MYYIKPCKGHITSLFSNARKHPKLNIIRSHQGVDIGNHADNTIVASASGVVRFVETNPNRTGYGYYIIISHPNGQETVYAHLHSIMVREGQKVTQGQKIGMKGTTGTSTGIHLHFEICKGRYTYSFDNKLDPLLYFVDPTTKELQEMLIQHGYSLVADGIYGDSTITAVTDYQTKNKFKTVDGVAGSVTFNHIKDNLPKSPPKPVVKPSEKPPTKKEEDEMAELLPKTQQNDMTKILKDAYTKDKDGNLITKGNEDKRVFSKDHSAKVSTMTRGEALDLLISYTARKI